MTSKTGSTHRECIRPRCFNCADCKTIATAMKCEDFRGGPSWCLRFMRRKGLSIRVRTSLCQQLPPDYEEKVSNFHKFTDAKIAEHSIDPHDINMDEVPLTFDLPLTRTVNGKGESSVTLKTTGHEKTHFTCVLSCTASGEKLPQRCQKKNSREEML